MRFLLSCVPRWFQYSILSMYKHVLTGILILLAVKAWEVVFPGRRVLVELDSRHPLANMRVLHVLDTINPAGAGPVEAARLYCTAADSDYDPEVLSLDENVDRWRHMWNVPVQSTGRSRLFPRYSAGLVPWLCQHQSRFDAVVVHSVWGYHLIGVWRALRGRTPYFVILHGSLNPWFRENYPRKHLKKILFWRTMTGRAVADAKAVFYLCPEEKRLADSAFPIRSEAEAFVPLGTLPRFARPEAFLARFPSLRQKRILLFLGRICYVKGCDFLVRLRRSVETNARRASCNMRDRP